MNSKQLASPSTEPLINSGDDPYWLQNRAIIEQEYRRLVEAGYTLQRYTQIVEQIIQQMETNRLLSQELRIWMESWDLGDGFSAAFAVANELLRSHLETLTAPQKLRFNALLVDTTTGTPESVSVRRQALGLVLDLLTPDDFHQIAHVVGIHGCFSSPMTTYVNNPGEDQFLE